MRSRNSPEADATRKRLASGFHFFMKATSHACRDLLKEGIETGYLVKGDLENYVIIVSGMLEGIGRVSEFSIHEKTQEDIKNITGKQ